MAASDTNYAERLVPALQRGARILDVISRAKQNLTISDISRELGLAKSSVHALCSTLVALNLLLRRSDQTYQLGPHIMRWANAFSLRTDVTAEFASIWDEGTELPGATITLSVLDGTEVIYIAARNSEINRELFNFRIGARLPAAFTATGKAFLSYMTDMEVRRLYKNSFPEPLTPNSVRDLDGLLCDLQAVRQKGYSFDNEQVTEGMLCFGAPVLNSENRPIAGVAVSLPVEDMTRKEEQKIIGNVKRIAEKISHRLGADIQI